MAAAAHREPRAAARPPRAAGGAVAWRPDGDVTGGGPNGGGAGRGATVLGLPLPLPLPLALALPHGGRRGAVGPRPGQQGPRGWSLAAPPAQPGRLFTGAIGRPGGTGARQAAAFVLRSPGPAGSGWCGGAGPEAAGLGAGRGFRPLGLR